MNERKCSLKHIYTFDEFSFEEEINHKRNLQALSRLMDHYINDLSVISNKIHESS